MKITPKRTHVESPKMTINKLGEFLVAPPKRQRRILEQLKYPEENRFGYIPYADVREAIKSYFIGGFNEDPIHECISSNRAKVPANDFQQNIITSSIEALEKVLDTDCINTDFEYFPYEGSNPKLSISGVEISVYPDLIVKSKVRSKEYVGALKIHISKNSSINVEGSRYISALLHAFGERYPLIEGIEMRYDNSISYDVFNEVFVESPRSVVRRMDDIEAGCLNIVAIWGSI